MSLIEPESELPAKKGILQLAPERTAGKSVPASERNAGTNVPAPERAAGIIIPAPSKNLVPKLDLKSLEEKKIKKKIKKVIEDDDDINEEKINLRESKESKEEKDKKESKKEITPKEAKEAKESKKEIELKEAKESKKEIEHKELKDVKTVHKKEESEPGEVEDKKHVEFNEMGLQTELLGAIYNYGLEHPSLIQQQVIPSFLTGNDLIVQSQAGTGKTASVIIPMLNKLITILKANRRACGVHTLILSPTKELANQTLHCAQHLIPREFNDMKQRYGQIRAFSCIGGIDVKENYNNLRQEKNNISIISGTLGRVNDLLGRGAFDYNTIKMLIIDEIDVLLKPANKHRQSNTPTSLDDLKKIIRHMPRDVQICIFSATIDDTIEGIANNFIRAGHSIILRQRDEEVALATIIQRYICSRSTRLIDKMKLIRDYYDTHPIASSIVFANSIEDADTICNYLRYHHYSVAVIHSSMSQPDRNTVISEFRKGNFRILVSTGVLERGFDFGQISHVFMPNLPRDPETYIHRIGRCGRFGKNGFSLSIIDVNDQEMMEHIIQKYDLDRNHLIAEYDEKSD